MRCGFYARLYFAKKKEMEKIIKLAGIPIAVRTLYDSLPHSEEYETDEPPVFFVLITEGIHRIYQRGRFHDAAASAK